MKAMAINGKVWKNILLYIFSLSSSFPSWYQRPRTLFAIIDLVTHHYRRSNTWSPSSTWMSPVLPISILIAILVTAIKVINYHFLCLLYPVPLLLKLSSQMFGLHQFTPLITSSIIFSLWSTSQNISGCIL